MSYAAYGKLQNRVENQRQVEYRLLAQVTGALIAARQPAPDRRQYYDAILWNQKVWDAFLHDLSSEENRLPVELRKRLIALCLSVRRETDALISGKGDIETLITVNRNIMEGLR
jgi:flagellar protein FlaF